MRIQRYLLTVLVFLALAWLPPTQAWPDVADGEVDIGQLLEDYDRVNAMAESATGDLRLLLLSRLRDREGIILDALNERVEKFTSKPLATEDQPQLRAELEKWLTELTAVVIDRVGQQYQVVLELILQDQPSKAADALVLETRIRRELRNLTTWLERLFSLSQNLEAMGLDTLAADTYLRDQLPGLAELLGAGISLALERTDDIRFNLSMRPDDAELLLWADVVKLQLDHSARTLGDVAGILEDMGLNTADYQSLVIQVTGELSSDVFSFSVIRSLFRQGTRDFRKWIASSGANVLFKMLLFLLITGVAWVISRLVRRAVGRGIRHLQLTRLVQSLIVSTTSNLVFLLGILVALSQLGISLGPLLAGLGVAGFIVGFALQETLGNFASGMMLLIYRPYSEGDLVEVAGVLGEVDQMTLMSTVILTPDNQKLVVPNNRIWGDVIRNINAQVQRRIDMEFEVSYEDDLQQAEALLKQLLDEHPKVLDDPEPNVRVHRLADSSVVFVVRPWVLSPDYWDTYWDLQREVKLRLAAEGMTVPYPQRDIHLRD